MTARSPSAFLLSALLHAAIVALIILFSYAMGGRPKEAMKVFELIAGEGDNYAGTIAPQLGTPEGVKIEAPAAPPPAPEPPQPEPKAPEPASFTPPPLPPPPTPAPTPKKEVEPKIPTAKDLARKVKAAETKVRKTAEKERAAEIKLLAEQEKKKAALTKAEFDAQNKNKAPTNSKSSPTKVASIDTKGIASGLLKGSPDVKSGAGGKALHSDNDGALGAYYSLFKQRMRLNFEAPVGLSDSVSGEFEFRSNADGSIVGVRVIKSSGSTEFDRAVTEAIRRVKMPPRPDSRSDTITFTFAMKDREEG